ncbi:MAG: hypothetical protein KJP09_02195 [Bacteroidia bacterium]|nr:hypothetical protein [Bacteroidia bacterium]MBT8309909.1 hypothetical protein [Bacteroidia bacterium]NND12273.1 hypothetical protein [Flavobacteriaceae bacterium]NNK28977.1 hypothetical protein [Flavobacteriaceae bacterium]NNL61792.1 hypothetical protein [Flavobacteriaceae bacterium]
MLLAGCSSKKQIEQELRTGNYDQAVSSALRQLQSRKTEKRKSKFIGILKESYTRVTNRDLDDIAFLKKDGNPANWVRIFEMYATLDARQRAIEPVLPLYIKGREVPFTFYDYTSDMIASKEKASEFLYGNAQGLLESTNKFDIRKAFHDLEHLERINPNYKNTQDLMQIALEKGRDYVMVSIENQSYQIIPSRLEEDLLDFDTYGLDDLWTVYHSEADTDFDYDFAMQLQLRQINISPERINERQVLREKEIVDGWEYQLDQNGNVMQDSLGNDIKIDKIVRVRARLFEVTQTKAAQVVGKVVYSDLRTNQLLDTFTIDSEFIFENLFARSRGDRRALDSRDIQLLNQREVPFPSDSQMVYDTGEDLKFKLKRIINDHSFRG